MRIILLAVLFLLTLIVLVVLLYLELIKLQLEQKVFYQILQMMLLFYHYITHIFQIKLK